VYVIRIVIGVPGAAGFGEIEGADRLVGPEGSPVAAAAGPVRIAATNAAATIAASRDRA
jgi:hypothetical protein